MRDRRSLNLTRVDRWGYVAGGLALLAWGLGRRDLAGAGLAGTGGWLLYQAYTGENPMFRPLGIRVNPEPAEPDATETIVVEETVTIGVPRQDVYRFWRDLGNLPRVAPQLRNLEMRDERRSFWRVDMPGGATVEWEAEITRDEPGRVLAWRTTRDRTLTHFGDVQFRDAPGNRGTTVAVHLEYVPPAGSLGTAVARMMGQAPRSLVRETLRRVRQLIETGEIPTTDGQPAGDMPRAHGLAGPIGWLSVGLGLAEVAAPTAVAKLVGAPPRSAVVRALGARELASGIGILSRRSRPGWMWARVGGDVLDLALLGFALMAPGARRGRVAAAAAAIAGITALDVLSSRAASREAGRGRTFDQARDAQLTGALSGHPSNDSSGEMQ